MPRMSSLARKTTLLILALLLGTASGAQTIDLDQAKSQGLVGETMEGYLGVVDDSASEAVQTLVEEINARRRAEYGRIAEENGIDVAQVEALAAKKAIEKTPAGEWVRVNGTWRQK